jgi:hypothetical protein
MIPESVAGPIPKSVSAFTGMRIQDDSIKHSPFDRLVGLLRAKHYCAAGIDAPFSLPSAHMPASGVDLFRNVSQCHRGQGPFPRAVDFLAAVAPSLLPRGQKVFRATERCWLSQGVNTRSTLWAGPRGGAAMTAACLSLLGRAGTPIWPWTVDGAPGCLVEAFPAAQLRTWSLPHQQYNGREAQHRQNRAAILAGIVHRIEIDAFRETLEDNADALDAVVAAFAAIAVTEDKVLLPPAREAEKEGWIAVHR